MNAVYEKCAFVIDEDLAPGLAMNTVAALSMSVGRFVEGIVGDAVKDADGRTHTGITAIPLPVLKGEATDLRDIVLKAAGMPEVFVVDFTAVAQSSRSYEEYTGRTAKLPTAELPYIGIAVCGSRSAVAKLTGSLPLYR
ncbi:DUF2000 domain-containing protein [Streptomyces zingiberis]|uniref:DUF2000 domain-containing protein n=1 Tax=Streptomyces zingiberis TaxID=2053010 RepID=A0ABX1BZ02_9ACTN|nr:DUF2000 domain-containing protein [Streptomyces zingiberis]NJQ01105.1 DUF2000 domain-containing protein [Streptomyces zingiberis]